MPAWSGPVIDTYLHRLRGRLADAGYRGELLVILSHGGVATVAEATRLAAGTALSGPAGGVAAAVALSREGLAKNLIAFDMGGTSTDIALVRDGQPALSDGKTVSNARIALPSHDIVTLGAGGGSIGKIDASGLLAVGPESAGAVPGPACYGQNGTGKPTVTGCQPATGFSSDPANFLGGRRNALDRDAAQRAVQRLADRLNLSLELAAGGIHRLVNTRMADGVRIATVRRGVDPRGYAILAFGGAAGLHVTAVAGELGVKRVVVPLAASVLSAWGMLNTDLRMELTRGQSQSGGIDIESLNSAFAAMERGSGRERLSLVRWRKSRSRHTARHALRRAGVRNQCPAGWGFAFARGDRGRLPRRARTALYLRIARSGCSAGQRLGLSSHRLPATRRAHR